MVNHMKNFRKKELEKHLPVWLTVEAHGILRKEKRRQKKSMMRIVDNLIKEKYATLPTLGKREV